MCGRFTLKTPISDLAEIFEAETTEELADLPARYNIAPTQPVVAVRPLAAAGGVDGGGGAGGTPPRELALLRWGLLPAWVKDPDDFPTLLNARAETLARKPAFGAAFRARRCLVPADGFFEWRRERGGKQPYFIRLAAEEPMALAGLWEHREDAGGGVESCTIVTTDANQLVARIHDRMPVILEPDAWSAWLDPRLQDPEALDGLLRPLPADRLVAYPVSRSVNRAETDGPVCIEPLEEGEVLRLGGNGAGRERPAPGAEGGADGDADGDGAAGAAEEPEAEGPPPQLDLF